MAEVQTDCLFCGIVAGDIPSRQAGENELCVAFHDVAPAAPFHVLVVPRRHITNAATIAVGDGEVLAAMMTLAREVASANGADPELRGYRLVMNVGPDALNSVPHLHLHVLAGQVMAWPPG
ncbi:MAG: HIT domain-containing protein [Actinomycetes bacterium]